jgi:iron complex transport system permease protein
LKPGAIVATVAFACVIAAGLALCAGPTGWRLPWPWTDVVADLRAPRVLLSGIVGASLALAGVLMQALLQNELADPYVLGLSGGASAGAVTSLALLPGLSVGPAAAAGAAGAATLVRALANGPFDPVRLLLAGVAVSSALASATGLILVLVPGAQLLRTTSYWLFGGIGTPQWSAVAVPAGLLIATSAWTLRQAEPLDRLTLGEDVAASLGVEVGALRRNALVVSVVLTASAVAVSGLVGFVGLIAPHAARRLVGQRHRYVLPLAALSGALLVISADAVARTAFAPREVPVGLLTAAVGAPFFLLQLRRGMR